MSFLLIQGNNLLHPNYNFGLDLANQAMDTQTSSRTVVISKSVPLIKRGIDV
jgi:hypothetical protein